MAASSTPDKKQLETEIMWTYRISSATEELSDTLLWKMENFYTLKDCKAYASPSDYMGRRMVLIKKRYALTVKLFSSHDNSNFICRILYGFGNSSVPAESKKVRDGEYEAVFPPAVIRDTRNQLLRKGQLAVHFKILMRRMARVPLPCRSKTRGIDKEEIGGVLLEISAEYRNTDFAIIAGGLNWRFYKAFLACRSGFFRNLFLRDLKKSEFHLDTTHRIFQVAFNYMYLGNMPDVGEEDCFQLLLLAVELEIDGLVNLCITHLIKFTNLTNAHRVKEMGVKNNIHSLVLAADEVLEAESQKRLPVFKYFPRYVSERFRTF